MKKLFYMRTIQFICIFPPPMIFYILGTPHKIFCESNVTSEM